MIGVQTNRPTARATSSSPLRLCGTRLGDTRFLSPEERDALERSVSAVKSFEPNVDLVREGGHPDSLFILVDGWACRYTLTKGGARQVVALLLPGDVCNLDSLMFDRLDFGVRTLSQVSVVALPRDRALALAAEHPGIARAFTWAALIENATLSKWVLSLGRRSAKERLAHLLCELSVRLLATGGKTRTFAMPMTQEQLADALGLTGVHVNRTLRELRAEGLVVTGARTVTLPDVECLAQIAGFDPRYLHLAP